MSYNAEHIAELGHIKTLAENVKSRLDTTIKFVSVSGNTINFFKTADGSGSAAFSINFPTEFFLDQAKTTFVDSFAYSASTYPGATNPNLNGKPVLVLALTGSDGSVSYSFLNMASLIDTYTVASGNSAKILTISGRTITVKISAASNQAITVKNDGLHVDISGKADKVSSATANNLAMLTSAGDLADSGILYTTLLTTNSLATDAEMTEVLTEVFGS